MKRSFQRLGSAAAIAAALALGSQSFAGARSLQEVSVYRSATGISASGSMYGARLSSDATQWIGCALQSSALYDSSWIQCSARNSEGTFAFCVTDSTKPGFWSLRDAVLSVGPHSRITFGTDSTGYCKHISVENYSDRLP